MVGEIRDPKLYLFSSGLCFRFEYDGNQRNFFMDLEACPCVLDQALLDLGRFMPYYWCDKDGDSSCPMHRGAQHCVMSVQPS